MSEGRQMSKDGATVTYLKNCWYIGAWDYEVTRELLLRYMLEQPILLYRKENGDAVAMSNICPHRYASLHMGQLIGDRVQCMYHGLQFDCTGRCVKNPNARDRGLIPPNATVRVFPTLERMGAVWVWMGDKTPDESLLPDYSFIDDNRNYRTIRGTFEIDNHYEMVNDNALDLTHVTFTHAGTLGAGMENVAKEQVVRECIGRTQWCRRFNYDITAGADFQRFNPVLQKVRVDKQQNVRWDPPGYILIVIRYVEAGTQEKNLTSVFAGNMLTPVHGTKTRMFWSVTRNFFLDSQPLDAAMRASANLALERQDKPMIEDQLLMMGTTEPESLRPVYIADDATPIQARRAVRRLLEQERGESQAATAAAPVQETVSVSVASVA
jgi:phenylpropionate dioxygenase-like ring-hydroxylating dioxygenase large terminal subunit